MPLINWWGFFNLSILIGKKLVVENNCSSSNGPCQEAAQRKHSTQSGLITSCAAGVSSVVQEYPACRHGVLKHAHGLMQLLHYHLHIILIAIFVPCNLYLEGSCNTWTNWLHSFLQGFEAAGGSFTSFSSHDELSPPFSPTETHPKVPKPRKANLKGNCQFIYTYAKYCNN